MSGSGDKVASDISQLPYLTSLNNKPTIENLLKFDSTLNLYSYVSNSPLIWIDRLGLDRFDICEDFGDIGQTICKSCISTACGFAYANKLCCKIDFDDCIGESEGDRTKMNECAAKLEACNLGKSKKQPKKPNN